MTNHIEELMNAAGVSKYRHFRQYNYAQVPHGEKELQKSIDAGIECVDVRNCKDNDCIYWNELHYPKFTPAKQLELIKLLSDFRCFQALDNSWVMTHCYLQGMRFYRIKGSKDFSDTLAYLILYLIVENQLNKSEVKKILED